MQDTHTQILGHLETILLIAIRKGDQIRNPWRYSSDSDPISTSVGLVCRELDELACPWLIQNLALNYINNADTSEVWDELHSHQLKCIAKDIYAKGAMHTQGCNERTNSGRSVALPQVSCNR